MIGDPDLASLGALAVYAVVWGFLFAECGLLLGFLLPGDTILFGAGLLAASPSSDVNLVVLVLGAFVAAVAGNEVGYLTGRRYGRDLAREPGVRTRPHAAAAHRGVLRALRLVLRRRRAVDPLGAHVHARSSPARPRCAARRSPRPTSSARSPGPSRSRSSGYVAYQLPVVRTIAFTIAGIFITISLVGLAVLLVRDALRRRRERDGASQRHHSGVT